jgi:hypothetical protein
MAVTGAHADLDPNEENLMTAGGWRKDCDGYLQVLAGNPVGDDLDITYCVGVTMGVLEGLETGSRIGAVSMASAMTVLLGLDGQRVFQLFETMGREELLAYCPPEDAGTRAHIEAIAGYIDERPEKSGLPVTAVFFEAMQSVWPCAPEPTGPTEPEVPQP